MSDPLTTLETRGSATRMPSLPAGMRLGARSRPPSSSGSAPCGGTAGRTSRPSSRSGWTRRSTSAPVRREQKAVNLVHNPHVSLTTGCNLWERGQRRRDRGRRCPRDRRGSLLARLAEAWTRKWDGRWRFTVGGGGFQHPDGGQAHVFAVAPSQVFVFGKGTFSQTRHLF